MGCAIVFRMNRRPAIPKALRNLFWTLFVLLFGWTGVIMSGLMPRLTPQQHEALALMRAPNEHARGERNAFELLWLLPRDIPEAERAKVFAADMAAIDALHPTMGGDLDLASAHFPRHVDADERMPEGCSHRPGCLAAVRANPETFRSALALRAPMLAELDQLGDYDHLRTPHRSSFAAPIPEFQQTGPLQLARAALLHVDGDTDAALTGLCHDLGAWRQLKGRNNSLIFEMITLAWLRGGVQLVADIRAELPAGQPLPAECAAALAPLVEAEHQSCDVYRAELAAWDAALDPTTMFASGPDPGLGDRANAFAARFVYSREHTRALQATGLAKVCATLRAPAATSAPAPETRCSLTARVFNPLGCILADVGLPDYSRYQQREQDVDALLQAHALADWLATQPDIGAAYTTRPESYRALPVTLAADARSLVLRRREQREDEAPEFTLPLPGSRIAPPAQAAHP